MTERILVRKIQENLWQWRHVSEGAWLADAFYTGDINLLKESIEGKSVWLIVSGLDVVSQKVETAVKDRRQLLKILPFEIEEDIIDPIEDLHFAFGPLENGAIAVAYGNAQLLQDNIEELVETGADVQRCMVDYLQLPREDQGWTLLLENGILLAHCDKGVGFSVEQELAPLYLNSLASSAQPVQVQLYADDEEGLEHLREMLPTSIKDNASVDMPAEEAGFWDLVDPKPLPILDFRTGRLARKLPFSQWWQDWKYPLVATAAAFLIAISANWLAQQQVDNERKRIVAQTDEIFRQAVPSGSISDPERQLNALLGGGGNTGAGSNAVGLLAGIAPAIGSMDEVKVRNFRYSVESGELQMNIEANSFATFESLRSKMAEEGFNVDIKRANVYGDVHQAQLQVSEAG